MTIVAYHVLNEILETFGYEDPEYDGEDFILTYWLTESAADANPELPNVITKDSPRHHAGEGLLGWPLSSVLDLINSLIDNFTDPGDVAGRVSAILEKK